MYCDEQEVQSAARLRVLSRLTAALLCCSLALAAPGLAQQAIEPIQGGTLNTPAGQLAVTREGKPICDLGQCAVVRLAGKVIDNDAYAGLVGAYPSADRPTLVAYYTHSGGNCCLPSIKFLDVSTTPAFSLGGILLQADKFGPKVKEVRAGVFELVGYNLERSKLGDPLSTTYIYDQRRRKVWQKADNGTPDYSDLIGDYPHDFLGNADRRLPLVKVVGEDSYGKFRQHLSVAPPIALKGYRWLVATGCVPHSCTSNEGFLAIDIRTGRIAALQFDRDSQTNRPAVVIWTDIPVAQLTDEYVLRSAVDGWLKEKGAKLADGPGPWRVVGASAAPTIASPSSVTPPPFTPGGWVNPNRAAASFGPSYDCTAKVVASQPLAQLICSSDAVAYAELGYVIAYQAVRESRDPAGRKAMVDDANALVVDMTDRCSVPKSGSIGRPANALEAHCLRDIFERQRQLLLGRAIGLAREEAELTPPEAIAIQAGLQERGFLPQSAALDGVFGPTTRSAILAWQRDVRVSETGYGSRAMLAALGVRPPSSTPLPPASTTSNASTSSPIALRDRSGKTAAIRLVLGDGAELRPQEVFQKASGSVYIVRAGRSFGSAVAISERELLTNCHIVGSNTSVVLEREGARFAAEVVSANEDGDRCVLRAGADAPALPTWVRVRPYADVKVGERVFTIGAPRGLELSFAEGIVSSKRVGDEGRLVQTSAPISQGSSGGGLFDGQGHLIGITTFMIKGGQNLNFAVAAEEYGK